tara:strand:+ start:473 stop:589 length:117 start_codon:yes stop_codon:yes gene_type:complete
MQIDLKKNQRYQRVEKALKNNLKKRKFFQKKKSKKNKK